jgi:hypothetical protein
MKTPKEKAKDIVKIFNYEYSAINKEYTIHQSVDESKRCALIVVNEIFEHIDYIFTELEKDKLPNKFDDEIEYWQEVKKEIELL